MENILNIHQVGEHRTYFYLNCDGYSSYRIVTDMKFMLIYMCVCVCECVCVCGTCLV